MQFIDIFLKFFDEILNYEILGFSLYTYLITITIVIIAFNIIHRMIKTKE